MLKRALLLTAVVVASGCMSRPSLDVRPHLSQHSAQLGDSANYYERGKTYLADQRLGLAIEAFRKDMAQRGPTVETFNGMAVAYDALGRRELTRRYLYRALALDPGSALTANNMAFLLARDGQYQDAAALLAPHRTRRVNGEASLAGVLDDAALRYASRANAVKMAERRGDPRPTAPAPAESARVEMRGERRWRLVTPQDEAPRDDRGAGQPASLLAQTRQPWRAPQPAPAPQPVPAPVPAPAPAPTPSLSAASDAPVRKKPAPERTPPAPVTRTPTLPIAPERTKVQAETAQTPPRIRLVNGNGRSGFAGRFSTYFSTSLDARYHLANAPSYTHAMTTIRYKPGQEAAAARVAALMPVTVAPVVDPDARGDVVVTLGADLLPFDATISRTGAGLAS